MSSIFPNRFIEASHTKFSNEVLANKTIDALKIFRAANNKSNHLTYSSHHDIFKPINTGTSTCVVAEKGAVRIDFSSAAIQGWAAAEIYDAEGVVEEVFWRAKQNGTVFSSDLILMEDLEAEIIEFIDKYNQPASLNATDLVRNSRETALALKI